jgi:hypothetical protein
VAKKKRADREAERRRIAFETEQRKIVRRRTVIGLLGVALGIVPFIVSLSCPTGTLVDQLCAVPVNVWLLIWAASFGSFLGLTIRLILERRRFERGTSREGTA